MGALSSTTLRFKFRFNDLVTIDRSNDSHPWLFGTLSIVLTRRRLGKQIEVQRNFQLSSDAESALAVCICESARRVGRGLRSPCERVRYACVSKRVFLRESQSRGLVSLAWTARSSAIGTRCDYSPTSRVGSRGPEACCSQLRRPTNLCSYCCLQ